MCYRRNDLVLHGLFRLEQVPWFSFPQCEHTANDDEFWQHQLLNQIWMQINFNIIEFNTYPWIAEDASDPERLLTLWENRCSKLCSCLEQWIPVSSDCYILRKPWTYEWCRNLKDNQCMRGCLLDLPFMIWPEKWFCMGRVFEEMDDRVNGPVPSVLCM